MVGKTKDAGWQVGVSRTVPFPAEDVWEYLVGPGLPVWLGADELGAVGSTYAGGSVSGEVRSRTDNVRVRLTHRAADAQHETTVQIALRPTPRGTTIVFHQERMRDEHEREHAQQRWKTIAARVVADLTREHHE